MSRRARRGNGSGRGSAVRVDSQSSHAVPHAVPDVAAIMAGAQAAVFAERATEKRSDGSDATHRMDRRRDGWYSLVNALGTSDDKVTQHRFARDRLLTVQECSDLYYGDDLAARIVDALPLEALRQPVKILVPDADDSGGESVAGEDTGDVEKPKPPKLRAVREDGDVPDDLEGHEIATAMQTALRELGAQEKVAEAAIWGRLYGGGAILLGTDDGQPHQPLNVDGVTKIRFLRVLDRRSLIPTTFYMDPERDDKFGEPMTYRVFEPSGSARVTKASAGVLVHESRLIMFGGSLTDATERVRNQGWDHSVLQRVWTILQQTNHAWQSLQHMIGNAAQAVLYIKGLIDLIEDGDKQTVIDRLEVLQLARLMKIMPVDADGERFEYVEQTFTGLSELVIQLFQRLAAAARMPLTVLFGMSPAGLNATGESDRAFWYDQVRAFQIHRLKAAIERIVEVLFRSKEGPTAGVEPDDWDVDFESLWQMTPQEVATLRSLDATADAQRITSGVLTADEVAESRFRPEGYGSEIQLDTEARAMKAQQQQPAAALNGAQVTSLVEVLKAAAAGEIPIDSAAQVIAAAIGSPLDTAKAMLGSIGTDAFVPASVKNAEAEAARKEAEGKALAEQQAKAGAEVDADAQRLLEARQARRIAA